MKVIGMRVMEKGRFDIFLEGSFFRGGMVQGSYNQFVECGVDGCILVLEGLNIGTNRANIRFDVLDVLLFLGVFNKQSIDLLGTDESHW
jgi:hypothetical protein